VEEEGSDALEMAAQEDEKGKTQKEGINLKMVRVAINGFGRIGRLVLRAGLKEDSIEFIAINDLSDTKTLTHLFKYDSTHGRFNGNVEARENSIVINNKTIKTYAEKEPENLPWNKLGIDIVVESTGVYRSKEEVSRHVKAGAKKVLLSAPFKGKESIKTIVMGVNEDTYKGEDIISNASCTTNCFVPMVSILDKNFGIVNGVMTTVHSYTNDQRILDAPHKDLRRARAASVNIIPTSTGAAEAIGSVLPHLLGKIHGSAIRVPTPDGSIAMFNCVVKKSVTKEQVNSSFKKASEERMKGILEYSEEPLVSTDIIGNPHSCIFDSLLTEVIDNNLVFVVGWYDNEWGYSNRMIDVINLMSK